MEVDNKFIPYLYKVRETFTHNFKTKQLIATKPNPQELALEALQSVTIYGSHTVKSTETSPENLYTFSMQN